MGRQSALAAFSWLGEYRVLLIRHVAASRRALVATLAWAGVRNLKEH